MAVEGFLEEEEGDGNHLDHFLAIEVPSASLFKKLLWVIASGLVESEDFEEPGRREVRRWVWSLASGLLR